MTQTYDPALVERAMQLVRDLSASQTRGCFAVEARAIVALLPDPDLEAAREIGAVHGLTTPMHPDDNAVTQAILAGIRYGREQAR